MIIKFSTHVLHHLKMHGVNFLYFRRDFAIKKMSNSIYNDLFWVR